MKCSTSVVNADAIKDLIHIYLMYWLWSTCNRQHANIDYMATVDESSKE